MKPTDPRYRKARSWVIRGARRHPGITFTASIGQYRLSCWYHDLGYHFRTRYVFDGPITKVALKEL
mgnify:CR=1 FL=1